MINMNQEQNNHNTDRYNNISNNQQSSNNKSLTFSAKFELIISIINFVFCLISICTVTGILISQLINSETGSSSGWFLFIVPIVIAMYISTCIPDALCLLFSFLYHLKRKIVFPILTIVFLILGCIMMNSGIITEIITGLNILQTIYTILKIIILIFNVIILVLYKKAKN